MIRRIDPDEAVTINGVPVSGRMLAEARQELSHRGVHNPRWVELSLRDQETAALSAGGWLRALAELVAEEASPSMERLAELDRANPLSHCGRCTKYVPLAEAQMVPTVLVGPDGVSYQRWHPGCVEAAKQERQAAR